MDNVITADFSKLAGSVGITDWSISRQFASRPNDQRYESVPKLLKALDERTAMSREIDIKLGELVPSITTDGDVGFQVNGRALRPTHYSFSQACASMDLPVGFFRGPLANDPDLVVRCIERAQQRLSIDDAGREIQVYAGGDTLRAITSQNYGRIEDREVVRALQEAIGESGTIWEVPTAFAMPGTVRHASVDATKEETTLYASDRDVCLFLVDQRNPIQVGFVTDPKTGERVPDMYSRGIVVRNGECGGVGLSITTFLYRWVCCNRSIREQIGMQSIKLMHRANVREHFMKKLVPSLKAYVNGSETGIADMITRAHDTMLVRNDEDCMERLTTTFSFAPKVAAEVMQRSLTEEFRPIRTAFDMIQAMTAHARSIPYADERMLIEREAGKLMARLG